MTQDYTPVVMESPFRLVDLDLNLNLNRSTSPPPGRDRVLVGMAAQPKAVTGEFDVLLTAAPGAPRPWVSCPDPHATARRLRDNVTRQPAACVALVQVLRMGAVLPPPDRLLVES
ncbi:enoyl-CoA hydratase/isomerase family protein, partial [Streptomyces sp. 2MCAF27]